MAAEANTETLQCTNKVSDLALDTGYVRVAAPALSGMVPL